MIPIFMYHQIADIPMNLDPLGNAIPPAQFEHQMSYLARNDYRCLTLPEAVRYLREGKRIPAKTFVLTFDDGYQDVHSKAYPILEKFGFTATVFLVAGHMGSLGNWWKKDGERSGLLLSWDEARHLAQRGFILGSHTLNHPRLSSQDDQSAFEEIRNSKILIQEHLDIPVDFFSYPYSDSDARTERLVESAGYTAACAGYMGSWGVFHMWRVPCVRGDTTQSFALKANGWYGKRTALRESTTGRFLRQKVRTFRRRMINRNFDHPIVHHQDLDRELREDLD
jgi:peptidoglycan/xylan/chitin deacetylase (PgdA/CDA1 family)